MAGPVPHRGSVLAIELTPAVPPASAAASPHHPKPISLLPDSDTGAGAGAGAGTGAAAADPEPEPEPEPAEPTTQLISPLPRSKQQQPPTEPSSKSPHRQHGAGGLVVPSPRHVGGGISIGSSEELLPGRAQATHRPAPPLSARHAAQATQAAQAAAPTAAASTAPAAAPATLQAPSGLESGRASPFPSRHRVLDPLLPHSSSDSAPFS